MEITKKEAKWISDLQKVLSRQPDNLVGFLSNGETIDFYRKNWRDTEDRKKPIASVDVINIDGGAY